MPLTFPRRLLPYLFARGLQLPVLPPAAIFQRGRGGEEKLAVAVGSGGHRRAVPGQAGRQAGRRRRQLARGCALRWQPVATRGGSAKNSRPAAGGGSPPGCAAIPSAAAGGAGGPGWANAAGSRRWGQRLGSAGTGRRPGTTPGEARCGAAARGGRGPAPLRRRRRRRPGSSWALLPPAPRGFCVVPLRQ